MYDKAELRKRLDDGRRNFLRAVEGRDRAALEQEPVCGVWSTRDLFGHMVDWNSEIMADARHSLGGPPPHHQPIEDDDAFNAEQTPKRTNEPWPVTLAAFNASFDDVLALLDDLDEAQLEQEMTSPWGHQAKLGDAFVWLGNHIDDHLPDLT